MNSFEQKKALVQLLENASGDQREVILRTAELLQPELAREVKIQWLQQWWHATPLLQILQIMEQAYPGQAEARVKEWLWTHVHNQDAMLQVVLQQTKKARTAIMPAQPEAVEDMRPAPVVLPDPPATAAPEDPPQLPTARIDEAYSPIHELLNHGFVPRNTHNPDL